MPRRPPTSGYARIAQAEEEEEQDPYHDLEDDDLREIHAEPIADSDGHYEPIQSRRRERMSGYFSGTQSPKSPHGRRKRTNSGVDIKAINARLERWADEIAHKFKIRKIKGKTPEEEQLEIHHSVFQAPDWIRSGRQDTLPGHAESDDGDERLSKIEYDDIVESVRVAIELGMHPKLIAQGSSGSYFARTTEGKVVGVFKPKDEEPYANKNPKWTKWIHRNLFPFFFGRACLIPNLSYVSEAAAYVLDCRLRTNIVPYTDVVSLSSKSFFYDFWERRAFYRGKKPLPEKPGSFQVFLKGYKDATQFLREHPWPDQHNSGFRDAAPKKKSRRWAEDCRPQGAADDDDEDDEVTPPLSGRERSRQRFFWTPTLQQSLREQLEKLVILDYIMRNTDRGLDNWMIRIDSETESASIVVDPPSGQNTNGSAPDSKSNSDQPYKRPERMTTGVDANPFEAAPRVRLGAIDNSLSWPWKHPDAWRSYPFGWLFLPVSLIGRPFSEATKFHFLPLLTSKEWWRETHLALRKCFEQDSDFSERMFARQMAVMKGQAWNVVETLKTQDHGPLELTRRARVCVWDDIVEIPVVTPMRGPSEEIKRKRAQLSKPKDDIVEEDELDIAAAYAAEPRNSQDLLGSSDIAQSLPSGNRFNISRQYSSNDVGLEETTGPLSPSSINGFTFDTQKESRLNVQPPNTRSRTRLSMEEPRRLFDNLGERRRRFSLGLSRRNTMTSQPDDDEGDLGFAAAEGQEQYRRKVIVERLETVKSKNPVFTWC